MVTIYAAEIAIKAAMMLSPTGSIFKNLLSGVYGKISVTAPTAIDEYNNRGAGLLLKNGLCVRITMSISSSVRTETVNQPL